MVAVMEVQTVAFLLIISFCNPTVCLKSQCAFGVLVPSSDMPTRSPLLGSFRQSDAMRGLYPWFCRQSLTLKGNEPSFCTNTQMVSEGANPSGPSRKSMSGTSYVVKRRGDDGNIRREPWTKKADKTQDKSGLASHQNFGIFSGLSRLNGENNRRAVMEKTNSEPTSGDNLSYVKRGMKVEVQFNEDWVPAIIVDITDVGSVIVQYAGDERCRETVGMTSGRIRIFPSEADSSDTVQGGAVGQLEGAARVAKGTGQRTVMVPLVASVQGLGWKERRQANEGWFGSWVQQDVKAGSRVQLPSNMVSFDSLQSLLDALDGALRGDGTQVGAKQAVAAMNHMKRLQWQCLKDDALRERMKSMMRQFALSAEQGMGHLAAKDLALVLNAVVTVLDARTVCPALSSAGDNIYTGGSAASPYSREEECVFWRLFASASDRVQKLNRLYMAHEKQGVLHAENPGKFSSQSLSMIANAFANAGIKDEKLLRTLSQVIIRQSRYDATDFSALSLSLIASSFVRLEHNDVPLFRAIASLSASVHPRHWDGASLSSLVHALHKYDALSASLSIRFAETSVEVSTRKFQPAHVARLLASLSAGMVGEKYERDVMGTDAQHDQAVLRRMYAHFAGVVLQSDGKDVVPQMAAHQIAHVLIGEYVKAAELGLATIADRDRVMGYVSAACVQLERVCVHAFTSRDVSMILTWFARAQNFDQSLFSSMGRVLAFLASSGRSEIRPPDVASLFHTYAQVCEGGHADAKAFPSVLHALETMCVRTENGTWAPAHVTMAVNGASRMRFAEDAVLGTLSRISARLISAQISCDTCSTANPRDHFTAGQLACITRGFAVLNYKDAPFLGLCDALLASGMLHVDGDAESQAQTVANLAWAAAVLGPVGSGFHQWVDVWAGAVGEGASVQHAVQMHQYFCEYVVRRGAASEVCSSSGPDREGVEVSCTHGQVVAVLRKMGWHVLVEWREPKTGYIVDAHVSGQTNARDAAPQFVLVEVDGPSHFSRGSRKVLGGTALKRKHLEREGYAICSVPYWEWDALNHADRSAEFAARERYLTEVMRSTIQRWRTSSSISKTPEVVGASFT